MIDSFLRTVVDDGKGRTRDSYAKPTPMQCVEEVKEKGDYNIARLFDLFDMLIIVCPFCTGVLETRYTHTRIFTREPLTLEDELKCGKCERRFHIINGLAIESWV